MINVFKFATQVARQFTLVDRTIAKIDLIVLGLLLAKLFPVLTSLHRGWYVAFIVLCEIYFIRRIQQMQMK